MKGRFTICQDAGENTVWTDEVATSFIGKFVPFKIGDREIGEVRIVSTEIAQNRRFLFLEMEANANLH